jgi:predicted TIM-barrel fold metal-dependent hydrolase
LIGRNFLRRSQYRDRDAWSISRQQRRSKRQPLGLSSSPKTPIAIKPGSCVRAIVLAGLTPAGALHARRPRRSERIRFAWFRFLVLRSNKLKNKIALEEHFAIDLTIDQSKIYSLPVVWERLKANLLDIEQQRLERMEEGGTTFSILSLNSPGIQGLPNAKEAIDVSRRANDVLAEHISRHPTKLGGFAALPMQDPEAAARELERCIKALGFHGFMVNGFSQVGSAETVAYYDAPHFADFWSSANALGKPFYMHPRDPLPSREPIYDGFPWLTAATWAFTMETSTHALRLMSSGLFDRNPNLQMILGHLGECIPFNIWRIDNIVAKAPRGIPCKRPLGDYFRENVHVTTSGNFRTPSLLSTMLEVGSDRILYAVDYPFESFEEASRWFDNCEISELDRKKIGRENARRLFGLP